MKKCKSKDNIKGGVRSMYIINPKTKLGKKIKDMEFEKGFVELDETGNIINSTHKIEPFFITTEK